MRGPVLIAAYHYSPKPGHVLGRRPRAFAKYLERLGHSTTVLTSQSWSASRTAAGAGRVVEARDLLATRLNWRLANREAKWIGQQGTDYRSRSSRLAWMVPPHLTAATWLPFALPSALRIARREPPACVITTSRPESTHLIGLALARCGVPWIADFRDGWRFESDRLWPTRTQRRIDAGLERAVIRGADAVIAVSEPIAADMRQRFDVDVETIANGFDPEDAVGEDSTDGLLSPDRHSLVHTGRMAISGRTPQPVLDGLRRLLLENRSAFDRLEVVFAGPITAEERRLLEMPELSGSIRHVGTLDRPQALALQRRADSLLVLTSGTRTGELTGKLPEYLATGRPILVVGDRSEAARVVRSVGAGAAVPADEPREIADAMADLVESDGRPSTVTADSREFSYPRLVERLADLVERVGARA
jgi:glycosyltransferase involved in cell wall biosynthesis